MGYINTFGELVIGFNFVDAWSFTEGMAPVKNEHGWQYIDTSGKAIQHYFDIALSFSEGLAAVKERHIVNNLQGEGKWGYIDRTGNYVISCQFDDVGPFSEGIAAVRVGEKWGYIDRSGKIVVKLRFDRAFPFTK